MRARVRRLARGALDQPGGGRGVRGRGRSACCTCAGRRDHPELAARALPDGYDLREYLDREDFAEALAAADLVVARAGGSVFEIAAHGAPAILVPYPHASADHQSANARWMARRGRRDRDRRRRAERGALGAGGRRRCSPTAGAWRRWRAASPRPGAPATPPREVAGELLEAARAMSAAERTVERAAPALRRRRRRRHERLRARGARARRRGERLRRRRRPLPGAAARRTACWRRSIGHAPRTCPPGEDVEVVYFGAVPRGERRARGRARARPARAPARGAAGGADRAEAHDRGGGHARQDDDRVDARARAARRRPGPGLAGRRAGRRRACRTRTGARASGWWSRPTSPTARCSA